MAITMDSPDETGFSTGYLTAKEHNLLLKQRRVTNFVSR